MVSNTGWNSLLVYDARKMTKNYVCVTLEMFLVFVTSGEFDKPFLIMPWSGVWLPVSVRVVLLQLPGRLLLWLSFPSRTWFSCANRSTKDLASRKRQLRNSLSSLAFLCHPSISPHRSRRESLLLLSASDGTQQLDTVTLLSLLSVECFFKAC